MTNLAMAGSTRVLVQLVDPALRALFLAACAGLGLVALKVRSTSLRLVAWTAVLYAALSIPLLSWMLPPVQVTSPAFLDRPAEKVQTLTAPTPAAKATDRRMESDPSPKSNEIRPLFAQSTAPRYAVGTSRPSIPWSTLAISLYGAVTAFLLVRLVIGVVFSRRLIRAAHLIHEDRVTLRLRAHAYACGIRSVPRVVESELISVPVTMGVLRSAILFPTNWREWDDAKLNAVLAHEVSHVARRDALTQHLSLLHRAIFWFSPLAWWLHRQLAALAEQASDEAALSCGADRIDYARTLLGFFEALDAAPGRVWWQGVSMAKLGQAEQRLERILAWKGVVTMGLKRSVLITVIAVAVPVVYLAASVRPRNASPQDSERAPILTLPAAVAPAAPPASSDLSEPALAPSAPHSTLAPPARATVTGSVSSSSRRSVAPVAPSAPVVAVAPLAPVAPWPHQSDGRSYSNHSSSYDEQPRFVIVTGGSDSVTMSGSSEDARHAEKLKKRISGDFIWFERDEKSYIIRDPATIDRARKLWAPQEELGKKQEALGKQQGALGKQQEELGKKMEQLQVKVPDLTAELDRLKAKLQKLGPSATMEQLGDLQSEIGDLQSKIGNIQSEAGEQQSKLGEQMSALGEQQGKLGEQQGKLGEQQGALAKQASRQMEELLDEAIRNGKAQAEPQLGGTDML